MEKIVFKKRELKSKAKRSAVVIKPETYLKIYEISIETNIPIETLVEEMLTEALKYVEIQ